MTLSKPVKNIMITQLHILIVCITLALTITSYITYTVLTQKPKPQETDISYIAPRTELTVQVKILSAPTTINGNTRFFAEVESIKDHIASGKVQISLRGMIHARRGDQITVFGDLQKARSSDIFLQNRGIFSQIFVTRITKGDKVLYQAQ